MKTKIFYFLVIPTLFPLFICSDSQNDENFSSFFSVQVGLNPYTATKDPFDRSPYLGLGYETLLSDKIGVGGSIFYGKWSDYLGMFCGKFTFKVVRPSLDLIYHFNLKNLKNADLFGGASVAYNFVTIDNELGNECDEELKNHLSVSPFAGVRFYLFKKGSDLLKRIAISAKVFWTVNGEFSGVYGVAGISFGIK